MDSVIIAMTTVIIVITCAFLLDYFLGDPVYRLHPVRLIGLLIRSIERLLNAIGINGFFGGLILLLSVLTTATLTYLALHLCLMHLSPWAAMGFDIFLIYSCLALKDMVKHASPIANVLTSNDLPKARALVQRIVGRDASALDSAQIARATIESIAESFVDGFLAPVFWTVALGAMGLYSGAPLPFAVVGILLYRCINTLDSMVGYRNKQYERFGTFSARADDVLNFVPARLSILLFTPAAAACSLSARNGWRIALRDRLKHASPNSAHTESFMAGALDLRLGGPTTYPHGTVDKPWIGDGTDQAEASHIAQACKLVTSAGCLLIFTLLIAGYFAS